MFRKSILTNSATQVMMRRRQSMSSTVKSTTSATVTTTTFRDVRTLSSLQHHHNHHHHHHHHRDNMEEIDESAATKSLKSLMDTLQLAVHLQHGPRTLTAYDMEAASVTATATIVVDPALSVVTTNTLPEENELETINQQVKPQSTAPLERPLEHKEQSPLEKPKQQQHQQQPSRPRSQFVLKKRREMEAQIQTLMNEGRPVHAMAALRECPVDLSSKFLYNFFRFLLTRNPLYAYEVLHVYYPQQQNHNQKQNLPGSRHEMYALLAVRIQDVLHKDAPTGRIVNLVYQLFEELKEQCPDVIPILLQATSASPFMPVKQTSKDIYQYLLDTNYTFDTDYLERLVSHSRFWSTDHLPFEELLQQLADASSKTPCRNPHLAVRALSNMYPFLDIPKVTTAVSALLQMAQQTQALQEQSDGTPMTVGTSFLDIDVGTLEHLLSSAARKGDYALGLLVWDLVDALEMEPTEGMYESMICAFVMAYRQDHGAFACLTDMELRKGYKPSRALIRGISRSLRFSVNRIDYAYRFIVTYKFGCQPTLSALNCIMSACAEIGDVERTFSVLMDDFRVNGKATPDVHSFSFAMESLAVSTQMAQRAVAASSEPSMMGNDRSHYETEEVHEHYHQQRQPMDAQEWMENRKARLEAAEVLLNMMQEKDIEIDSNVFHQYIRVLINCGEIEKASIATLDALGAGRSVENVTMILVFNNVRDINVARTLIKSTSEPLDFLHARLQKWETEGRDEYSLDNSDYESP